MEQIGRYLIRRQWLLTYADQDRPIQLNLNTCQRENEHTQAEN